MVLRVTLPALLALALLAPCAFSQDGSIVDKRDGSIMDGRDGSALLEQIISGEPASASAMTQAKNELLELIGFQEQLLVYLPNGEEYRARLSSLKSEIDDLNEEELSALARMVEQVPEWDIMIRKIRSLDPPPEPGRDLPALKSASAAAKCSAPLDPACDDPELEEAFYPFPIPTAVVETAWITEKVAELLLPPAVAICRASPAYPLFINAITCTVSGIIELTAFISKHIVQDSDRINGNYGVVTANNTYTYTQSIFDLTVDNSRFTDDGELATQTDTLVTEINENQGLLEAIGEASCEIIRLLNTPPGQRTSDLGFCSEYPGWPYDYPNGKDADPGTASPATSMGGASTLFLEQQLTEGRVLPSLYLPATKGGLIEDVRDLVWNTIKAQVSLGYAPSETERARLHAQEADRLLAQQSYADAYRAYSTGFQELIPTQASASIPSGTEETGQFRNPDDGTLTPGQANVAMEPLLPLLGTPVPNPASGRIAFTVNLPDAAMVRVRVYDIAGRLVEELVNRRLEKGQHDLSWQPGQDGVSRPGGVYFLRLEAGDLKATRRFVLVH